MIVSNGSYLMTIPTGSCRKMTIPTDSFPEMNVPAGSCQRM